MLGFIGATAQLNKNLLLTTSLSEHNLSLPQKPSGPGFVQLSPSELLNFLEVSLCLPPSLFFSFNHPWENKCWGRWCKMWQIGLILGLMWKYMPYAWVRRGVLLLADWAFAGEQSLSFRSQMLGPGLASSIQQQGMDRKRTTKSMTEAVRSCKLSKDQLGQRKEAVWAALCKEFHDPSVLLTWHRLQGLIQRA